mmetsp:Transcript_6205/g.9681  ORF Transcript_6205/g.9681 Transcript_6205/m.9681 type:complete len:88 (-) Transcript_6205:391-654(-)
MATRRSSLHQTAVHSDKSAGITLTGDEFTGEILNNNKAFIPRAVEQFFGQFEFGPLFDRFLLGTIATTPPTPIITAPTKMHAPKQSR